jgi:hypothetical protein
VGDRILVAPDGTYAVFSTVTDTIVFYDATEEDLVERAAIRAAEIARQNVREEIERIRTGGSPWQMPWDEAVRQDREHGGEVHLHYQVPANEQRS